MSQPVQSASTSNAPPPSTPHHRETVSAPTVTPFAKGTNSMQPSEDREKHKTTYYESYLEQDWAKGKAHIPLAAFCAHLLRISITDQPEGLDFSNAHPDLATQCSSDFSQYAPRANTRVAQAIIDSEEYRAMKQAYIKAKGGETARYMPFCNIVNYVIDVLGREAESAKDKGTANQSSTLEIVLVRNDPKCIKGSIGARKPDVVAIRKADRFVKGEEGQVPVDRAQNWKIRKMNPNGFCWSELLFFVEFEAESNQNTETRPGSNSSSQRVKFGSNEGFMSGKVKTPVASTGSGSSSKKRPAEAEAGPSSGYRVKKSKSEGNLASEVDEADGEEIAEPEYTKTGIGYHLKCAGYALEMFANGGFRTFVLGFLLNGNSLQLCSYQRSKIILSHPFNFLDDDRSFIAIIEGLVRCDHEKKLGINKLLISKRVRSSEMALSSNSSVGDVFSVYPEERPGGVEIEFTKLLYIQRALICRGTHVLKGEVPVDNCPTAWLEALDIVGASPKSKVEVVLKASSVSKSRTEEHAFIDKAVRRAKENTSYSWALLRLPTVLHSETSRDTDDHELRSAFALKNAEISYELRELRVLVLAPLFPVTQATSGYEVLRLYIDYIQVHKFLLQCGILHRDISLNNLMFRIRYVNGIERKYGVLNDLDLAMELERNSITHEQRTGTQPFMACELLHPSPPRHYPRHDLESIYYSMLIHVFHWHDGKLLRELPYRRWLEATREELLKEKLVFLSRKGRYRIGNPTPNFNEVFRSVLVELHNLFKSGIDALRDHLDDRPIPFKSQVPKSAPTCELDRGPYVSAEKGPESESGSSVPASFNLKTLDGRITHDTVLLPLLRALEEHKLQAMRENVYVEDLQEVKFSQDRSYDDEDTDNEELLDHLAPLFE